MSDARLRNPLNQWIDQAGDRDGRALVVEGGKMEVFSTTGAAAISLTTTMKNRTNGRPWRLRRVSATFSTAPTTSENFTITHVNGGETGARPLTVCFSTDPSVTSATSIEQIFDEGGRLMLPADEVTIAYTNTDTRTIKVEAICEVL